MPLWGIYTDFLAIVFNVSANIRVISVIRVLFFSSKRLQKIFQTRSYYYFRRMKMNSPSSSPVSRITPNWGTWLLGLLLITGSRKLENNRCAGK